MPRPSLDVATELAAVLSGFTLGNNLFYGPVRAEEASRIPGKSIFVLDANGAAPQRQFRGLNVRTANVDVRCRGVEGNFDDAETLARTVWLAVKDMALTGLLAPYIEVRAASSEPDFVGMDDQEHWEFSIGVEAIYAEP